MSDLKQLRSYYPHSVLREPAVFFRHILSDLSTSFYIGFSIFQRDFSARYRQTLTGYLGALFPVIMTTASFVLLQKMKVINTPERGIDYVSFVFINTIFWELFSESILGPTKELQTNISAIIRLNFPRESIFLASILNILSSFAIKILVAVLIFPFLDIHVGWNMLVLIPIVFGLLCWGILFGLFVLPVTVLYSDFRNVIDAFLRLLFFLTPIAYEISSDEGIVARIKSVNFLNSYFSALKHALFYGTAPDNIGFIIGFSLMGFILLTFGWVFYRVSLPILVERMPS
jgi:lipopolysaccharide transport system permease protein